MRDGTGHNTDGAADRGMPKGWSDGFANPDAVLAVIRATAPAAVVRALQLWPTRISMMFNLRLVVFGARDDVKVMCELLARRFAIVCDGSGWRWQVALDSFG